MRFWILGIFFALLLVAASAQAVNEVVLFPVGLKITMTDYLALRDIVSDPEQWIRDAVKGKIAASKSRMRAEWMQRLPDLALPGNDSLMVQTIAGQKGYLNRAQRDSVAVIK